MEIITREQASERGLKKYFTGKPCRNGHVVDRHVRGGNCTACLYDRHKTYVAQNPDKVAQSGIATYQRNKDKAARKNREYRLKNKEKIAERQRLYSEKNKAIIREWKRSYQRKNRGLATAREAKRRASIRRATPAWADAKAINAIYEEAAQRGMEVDHVVPIAGKLVCGLHVHNNLQIIDSLSNKKKSNKFHI